MQPKVETHLNRANRFTSIAFGCFMLGLGGILLVAISYELVKAFEYSDLEGGSSATLSRSNAELSLLGLGWALANGNWIAMLLTSSLVALGIT